MQHFLQMSNDKVIDDVRGFYSDRARAQQPNPSPRPFPETRSMFLIRARHEASTQPDKNDVVAAHGNLNLQHSILIRPHRLFAHNRGRPHLLLSQPYQSRHSGTLLSAHTDEQCLRRSKAPPPLCSPNACTSRDGVPGYLGFGVASCCIRLNSGAVLTFAGAGVVAAYHQQTTQPAQASTAPAQPTASSHRPNKRQEPERPLRGLFERV
jgi:hypothetical protein